MEGMRPAGLLWLPTWMMPRRKVPVVMTSLLQRILSPTYMSVRSASYPSAKAGLYACISISGFLYVIRLCYNCSQPPRIGTSWKARQANVRKISWFHSGMSEAS